MLEKDLDPLDGEKSDRHDEEGCHFFRIQSNSKLTAGSLARRFTRSRLPEVQASQSCCFFEPDIKYSMGKEKEKKKKRKKEGKERKKEKGKRKGRRENYCVHEKTNSHSNPSLRSRVSERREERYPQIPPISALVSRSCAGKWSARGHGEESDTAPSPQRTASGEPHN